MRNSWSSLPFLPRRAGLVLIFSSCFWLAILTPSALPFILHEQLARIIPSVVALDNSIESHSVAPDQIRQIDGEEVEFFRNSYATIDAEVRDRIMPIGYHKEISESGTHRVTMVHFDGEAVPDHEFIHSINAGSLDDERFNLAREDFVSMFRRLLILLSSGKDEVFIISHSTFGPMKGIAVFISPPAAKLVLFDKVTWFLALATIATLGTGLFLIIYAHLVVKNIMSRVSGDRKILGLQSAVRESSQSDAGSQTIQGMQEELIDKFEQQSRLARLGINASYLAHDIRNILANLQLNADRLSNMRGASENAIGDNLTKSIEQCVSLLNWAVLFASEQARSIEKQEVLLKPILQEAIEFAQSQTNMKISCILECDERFTLETNRILLFRAIYNLLHNSAKEMQRRADFAQLRIFVAQVDGQYEIYVSDTGGGFAIEGEQSYRNLNIQRLQKGGSGLGLKIARDLISWLGGEIELIRSNAAGTQFLIVLPRSSTPSSLITEAKN